MILSLATLATYGFNKRRLTEEDFYAICEQRKIVVEEADLPTSFYFCLLGKEVIGIDRKLKGVAREFALFHELSHAMLGKATNGPRALFQGLVHSPEEDEADAFACIALIPKANLDDSRFVDECCCGVAFKIYMKRIHILRTYGI